MATPLVEKHHAQGIHELHWQGRDAEGQSVASGVYFAVLRVDGQRAGDAQRLVLLK